MAKYQVKQGDSLASIASKYKTTVKNLQQKNRIFSVSRGQEIDVPVGGSLPLGLTPSQAQTLPPVQQLQPYQPTLQTYPVQPYSTQPRPAVGGSGSWFNINQPTTNYQAQNQQAAYMSQYPSQGTITNPQALYMSQFPGQGTITNDGVRVVNPPTAAPVMPQRPQGTYSGNPQTNANDAAWVAYWNYQAANPPAPSAPSVMTKAQIWEMKKNARVRKQAEQQAEQGYQNQYTPFFTGNAVSNLALRAK
jgi:LysM repeat protein